MTLKELSKCGYGTIVEMKKRYYHKVRYHAPVVTRPPNPPLERAENWWAKISTGEIVHGVKIIGAKRVNELHIFQ